MIDGRLQNTATTMKAKAMMKVKWMGNEWNEMLKSIVVEKRKKPKICIIRISHILFFDTKFDNAKLRKSK